MARWYLGLVAVAMWGLTAGAPLLTPEAVVDDPLVAATPAPAGPLSQPGPGAPDPAVTPDATVPDRSDQSAAGLGGVRAADVGLLVAVGLTTLLSLIGLRERIKMSTSITGMDPAGLPFPTPAGPLVTAPGTTSASTAFRLAAQRRFDLRVEALVLPVLAQPRLRHDTWVEWHDAVDSWLWHESWLRAASRVNAVEADGLLVGEGPTPVAGHVWVVTPDTRIGVLPAADGVILSRPAATTLRELSRRWSVRIQVWQEESHTRPTARLVLLDAMVGFPLAVVLPVVALLTAAPVPVVAACLAPAAVGVLVAALRWAALDDLDRSTSMRAPLGSGLRLTLTEPVHSAVIWLSAIRETGRRRSSSVASLPSRDEAAA